MKILICNVGSTSLKYQLIDMAHGERAISRGKVERVGSANAVFSHSDDQGAHKETLKIPTHREAILKMLEFLIGRAIKDLSEISCVGFKVVHGGEVTGVQFLDDAVLSKMEEYSTVAPAHNPPYIAAIRQFRDLMPGVPLIGSFETGFHKNMPPEAYLYPIPLSLYREHGVRRYGFHGASHEYVTKEVEKILGRHDLKIISCHMGGSGSLCAVKNGVSIDTSMGMSLQCGIMHNNRCGDIDPYIIFYMMEDLGMGLEEVKEILDKKSGLLGISGGISGDLRDVEEASKNGNKDAETALLAYCYGVKKYIGAYAAALGGVDAIAFAGGIGENSATVRSLVCKDLGFLGAELDEGKNQDPPGDGVLSTDRSRVKIIRVFTNEEIIVARKAMEILTGRGE